MSRENARPHLDERLALAAPRLFRALRRLLFKLRPSSPLRRRFVRHAAIRGWDALARGDTRASLLVIDPDYELNLFGERFRALGFAARYHGHAGMFEFIEAWRTAWASIDYNVQEILDLGDRVVIRFTTTSRGLASGVEVSATAGAVYFIVDATVHRMDFYFEWEECARALGWENRSHVAAP